MKKNESSLPADLQSLLQETNKTQMQDSTKVLHSAVTKLGKAKKSLQEARASRLNLHNVWRQYLTASIDKWQDFCADFEKKDADLAGQVQKATVAVKEAQAGLESSKKRAKEIEEDESDGKNDKDEMAWEISDEEETDTLDSKGSVIKDSMQNMLRTLESLKAQADSMTEENVAKKPRLASPGEGMAGSLSSPSMTPFHQPGQ